MILSVQVNTDHYIARWLFANYQHKLMWEATYPIIHCQIRLAHGAPYITAWKQVLRILERYMDDQEAREVRWEMGKRLAAMQDNLEEDEFEMFLQRKRRHG